MEILYGIHEIREGLVARGPADRFSMVSGAPVNTFRKISFFGFGRVWAMRHQTLNSIEILYGIHRIREGLGDAPPDSKFYRNRIRNPKKLIFLKVFTGAPETIENRSSPSLQLEPSASNLSFSLQPQRFATKFLQCGHMPG